MGNILVNYFSKTGHTARMAELVAEGAGQVPGHEIKIVKAENLEARHLLEADGIALGSPTWLGLAAWPLKKAWDDLTGSVWQKLDGKIGCAFSSSGGWGGGSELTCQSMLTMMLNLGMLVFGLPDYTAPEYTLHYGAVTAGKPEKGPAEDSCILLGKRLAQWVAVMKEGRADLHPRKK